MCTINYRFNPGDYVYGVHFYPAGAKIFKGEIIEMISRVTKNHTFLGYKLSAWPINYFQEENIFLTVLQRLIEKEKLKLLKTIVTKRLSSAQIDSTRIVPTV